MREADDNAQNARVDLFGTWVRGMYKYFGKALDPEVEKIYRSGLSGIPVRFLEEKLKSYLEQPNTKKKDGPPAISDFAIPWRSYQQSVKEREEREKAVDRAELSDIEMARRLVHAHTSIRLAGSKPPEGGDTPELVTITSKYAAQQFFAEYPDGTRGMVHSEFLEVTERFIQMAVKLFDETMADNYQTEETVAQ